MKHWLWIGLLALGGCGRYDDFTLPVSGGNGPGQRLWRGEPKPVMARSPGWDAVDALNPTVIEGRDGRL